MQKWKDLLKDKKFTGWAVFIGSMLLTFLLGLFASSVMERRVESRVRFQINTPISDLETDSSRWKSNFPREYERWLLTSETNFKSKYAGSATHDLLAEHPNMVILWAGYAFSREYNQSRGHFRAVEDVRNSLRTAVPQPGTCWTCKSPDVPKLMKEMGISNFYASKWADIGPKIHGSVGCYDCHDPKTMDLHVVRPAIVEAFARQGKDIRKATHQEMRSLVCAQCHVEYYFTDKKSFYLTHPWDKGYKAEDVETYYDSIHFYDWEHPLSKTPMLKAQHPDWELAKAGIHSQRGVSCADCHMPYISQGGVKITDHHIQSPLNNVDNTCKVCHGSETETLIKNVYDRQDAIQELRLKAEDTLARAHIEAKFALERGITLEQLVPVQKLIRSAQWRWDYVAASIGGSFHAPLECARVLSSSIEKGGQARLLTARLLAKKGYTDPVPMPDISTKEKAQSYIGLNMEKITADKKMDLRTNVNQWGTNDYRY